MIKCDNCEEPNIFTCYMINNNTIPELCFENFYKSLEVKK